MITDSKRIGLAFTTMKKVKHCRVNFKAHQPQTINHALYEILVSHGKIELQIPEYGNETGIVRCFPIMSFEGTDRYPLFVDSDDGFIYQTSSENWFLGIKFSPHGYCGPTEKFPDIEPYWVLFNTETKFALWFLGKYNRPDKPSKQMYSFYINNQHCAPGHFGKNGIARILGHGGYVENPVLFAGNEWKDRDYENNEFVLPADLLLEDSLFLHFARLIISFTSGNKK